MEGLTTAFARALAVIIAALSLTARAAAHEPGRAARLPTIGPAPAFALATHDGGRLTLAELRGRVVVVTFVYATCTDTCPLLTSKLAAIGKRLGDAPVSFVAITVDPERDTPQVLKNYGVAHGATGPAWRLLTGTPAEVAEVIRRYGVFARRTERGEVDHTFLTSLIDRQGVLRVQYMGVRFNPDEMLGDLRALLRESDR